MSQPGPLGENDNKKYVTKDDLELAMEAMTRKIEEMLGRGARAGVPFRTHQGMNRPAEGSVQEGSAIFGRAVPINSSFEALDEPRTSKHLARIAGMIPPGGKIWMGITEKRSARRFLIDCAQKAVENGLDSEGLTSYFLTKCVNSDTAAELADHCHNEYLMRPIPYDKVVVKMEGYFQTKYEFTNSTDRLLDHIESGVWAKDAKDYEQYVAIVRGLIKECEILGIELDNSRKRRMYVKWLPKELRDYVDLHCEDNISPEGLVAKITRHVSKHQYLNAISSKTFSGKPISVKVVSEEADPTADATVNESGLAAVGRQQRGDCLLCHKNDHYFRDCPFLEAAKSYVTKSISESADAPVEGKPATKTALKWASVVLISSAGRAPEDAPMLDVRICGLSVTSGVETQVLALLDTGAARSLCSKAFAERLYDEGILKENDVVGKRELSFRFANSDTSSDIGHIRIRIDGIDAKLYVLDTLTPTIILGNDYMPKNPKAISRIHSFLTQSKPADSGVDSIICVANSNMHKHHAEWPEINFKWLSDERPKSNLKNVLGHAKSLERSLALKNSLDSYDAIVEEWTRNHWLVESSVDEIHHFMQHFAVLKGGDTTMGKCRLVVNGSGLKEFLHPGECSHNDILNNLLLWRAAERYSVVDISSAFMRLAISDYDSRFMGIYWRGKAYRFRSLPMGICLSASALQSCVDSYIADWHAVEIGNESIKSYETKIVPYMDDLLQLLIPKVCFSEAVSPNDERDERQSLTNFLDNRRMKVSAEKLCGRGTAMKVLGVSIDSEDNLTVVRRFGENVGKRLTRAEAVSLLSKGFDPLGLDAELLLWARTLISETSGLAWKQLIDDELQKKILCWKSAAERRRVTIPRHLNLGDRLFVFADASHVGIGIVVLARDKEGRYQRLVAKSSVYKKHQKEWIGISSKIELLALQHAVQLTQYVLKCLKTLDKQPRVIFGTDSEVNITRLHDANSMDLILDPWQRKVSLLCARALKNMNATIYHCPGKINPADSISRGSVSSDVDQNILVQMAVKHFVEERGFVPTGCRDIQIDASAGQDEGNDEGDCSSDVNVMAVVPLVLQQKSLTARYHEEAKSGQSREEWFHEYQKGDPALIRVFDKNGCEVQNDVWVKKSRQNLSGERVIQWLVPRCLIPNVLFECHEQNGHLGAGKLVKKVLNSYTWRGVGRDCRNYATVCEACQTVKGTRTWLTPPSTMFTDGRCWSVASCDLVKGLDDGILLVTVDMYSRYMFTAAIPNEKAETIVKVLNKIFVKEGPCRCLVTDNAAVFTGKEFKKLCDSWDIRHRLTPRYSGWYGGWYERSHATIVKTMAILLYDQKRTWKQLLEMVTLYVNSRPFEGSVNDSALTPFEVFKGRRLFNFTDKVIEVENPIPSQEQVEENLSVIMSEMNTIRESFEDIWMELREKSMSEMERKVQRVELFKEGDSVYVWIPKLLQQKVGSRWAGPFTVEKMLGENGNRMIVNGKEEHAFNLKKCKEKEVEISGPDNPPISSGPASETVKKAVDELGAKRKRVAASSIVKELKERVLSLKTPGGVLLI